MQIPVHLSGRGLLLSQAQETRIREAAAGLERFFDRIVACRVVVSVPHHRPGGEPVDWSVRLTITVPEGELHVNRQVKPSFREAVDDAFDAGRRQLQDHARQLRGDIKTRAPGARGRISRLYAFEGYGFITTEDGREIHFERQSVPGGGFDRLEVGRMVRFVEQPGQQGPQASTVVPLDGAPVGAPGAGGGVSWE